MVENAEAGRKKIRPVDSNALYNCHCGRLHPWGKRYCKPKDQHITVLEDDVRTLKSDVEILKSDVKEQLDAVKSELQSSFSSEISKLRTELLNAIALNARPTETAVDNGQQAGNATVTATKTQANGSGNRSKRSRTSTTTGNGA